jgi:hypothetical protein
MRTALAVIERIGANEEEFGSRLPARSISVGPEWRQDAFEASDMSGERQ